MKGYTVIYERGPTSWGAYVPDLPGCAAVGDSREEVEALIREGIRLYIETLERDGNPIPEPASTAGLVAV